jgi:hypothetical protein
MDDITWTNEPEAAKVLIQNILLTSRILSPTGMEREMIEFCSGELMKCGFEIHVDEYGNIMAIRGRGSQEKFVLLNAHMDTVDINKPRTEIVVKPEYIRKRDDILTRGHLMRCGFISSGKARIKAKHRYDVQGGIVFDSKESHNEFDNLVDAYKKELDDLERFVFSNQKNPDVWMQVDSNPWQPERIVYNPTFGQIDIKAGNGTMYMGGDDKAGVSMILTLAQLTNLPFKVLFTVAEEREWHRENPSDPGTYEHYYGIQKIPSDFYNDVAFDLTLDKGEHDLLVDEISGYKLHPKEFSKYIMGIAEQYGHPLKLTHGFRCDALWIRHFVAAANMSTGYIGAHTAFDKVDIIGSHNMMMVVKHVIEDYNKYPVVFDPVVNKSDQKKKKKEVEPDVKLIQGQGNWFTEVIQRMRAGYTRMEDGRRLLDLVPNCYYNLRNDLIVMENRKAGEKKDKKKQISSEQKRDIQYYIDLGYSRKAALEIVKDERSVGHQDRDRGNNFYEYA